MACLQMMQPPKAQPSPTGVGPPLDEPGACTCPAFAVERAAAAAAPAAPASEQLAPAPARCAAPSSAPSAAAPELRLAGVHGWRFSQPSEDLEWLMVFSAPDGSCQATSWQVLYSISDQQQWEELQKFLLPQLTVLRSLMRGMLFGAAGLCPAPSPAAASYHDAATPACCDRTAPPPAAAAAIGAFGGGGAGAPSVALGGQLAALLLFGPQARGGVPLFQPTPHAFKPYRRDFVHDWRYCRTRDQVRSEAPWAGGGRGCGRRCKLSRGGKLRVWEERAARGALW